MHRLLTSCVLPSLLFSYFIIISANDGNGNCDDPYDENCVNKDVADNTNLCFADLSQGEASSHFTSDGFAVFPEDNNDGEGAIHCHGFAWADDEYETTSRYRSNNLFFVSMYDHMYQRGYVKNIPGMPVSCCCLLLLDKCVIFFVHRLQQLTLSLLLH